MNANANAFVPRQRKTVSADLPELPEAEDLFELTVEEEIEELGRDVGGGMTMRSPPDYFNGGEGEMVINGTNGAAAAAAALHLHHHHHHHHHHNNQQQQQQQAPAGTWPKGQIGFSHPQQEHSQIQYQNQFQNLHLSMGAPVTRVRAYFGNSCIDTVETSHGPSVVKASNGHHRHHHHHHQQQQQQQHSQSSWVKSGIAPLQVPAPSEVIQMLQKEFPSYSPESLEDILEANDNNVSLTIDVLTQLELETDFSQPTRLQPVAPALNDINFPELS